MPAELNAELTSLRRGILTMGARVESRVADALRAFLNDDLELARSVIERDHEIDQMDVDIEAECIRILALCRPVARDLRAVLSALRIENDLERIGDLAKGVAKRAVDLSDAPPVELPAALTVMADNAQKMLSDALRALADKDAALARQVRGSDQIVDDMQKKIFAWAAQEIPSHTDWTRGAIDTLSVARAIERIADLCTNIGEDVIFQIEGEVVRHSKV